MNNSSLYSIKFIYYSVWITCIMWVKKRLVSLLTDIVKLKLTGFLSSVSLSERKSKANIWISKWKPMCIKVLCEPKTSSRTFIVNNFKCGYLALASIYNVTYPVWSLSEQANDNNFHLFLFLPFWIWIFFQKLVVTLW